MQRRCETERLGFLKLNYILGNLNSIGVFDAINSGINSRPSNIRLINIAIMSN